MTSAADDQIAMLEDAVLRAVTALDTGFGAVMRDHLNLHRGDSPGAYGPGMVCLSFCEGLGAKPGLVLDAAVSLALLAEAGRVFIELDGAQTASLTGEWGMPRALNAGDGFYALAKDRLAQAAESLPSQNAATAVAALDAGARSFAEAIAAGAASPPIVRLERAIGALYPAAARLAGLFADADTTTMAMFEQMGAEIAAGVAGMSDAELNGPRVRLLNKPSIQILHLGDQQ